MTSSATLFASLEAFPLASDAMLGRRIEIRGTVQGVGFRPWVYRLARAAGLAGQVMNDAAGVVIEAFGPEAALDVFCARLAHEAPAAAVVASLAWRALPAGEPPEEFVIVASETTGEPRLAIPPDLAPCPDCLAELADPRDRRHRYAFTNCTQCGPRFAVATALPYDRPGTTMAPFELCADCAHEYADPTDRRFHAQPTACPRCGPRLTLATATGEVLTVADPLGAAGAVLRAGAIVAIQGVGGFHLACDAGCATAVAQLRARKERSEKPFAVLVADLETARRLAFLGPQEERLLGAPERPIVLARRRRGRGLKPKLAAAVAPGIDLVGLLLPDSPLHHLLATAVGRPLVLTSGNRSGEPLARSPAEARERLAPVADLMLWHDREVAVRCDDSVVRVVAGSPLVLRRSRGFVPRAIELARAVAVPTLGCGGHLKNTVCLAVGKTAWLGPHVGDLESPATFAAYGEAIEHLERLLGLVPELIAHDLHPEYLSTVYARGRAAGGLPRVAVQHHVAHAWSALAEHGRRGPALAVVFDGQGLGPDGSSWGGELLFVAEDGWERLACLRPLPLAGGDRAVKEIWRLAVAALEDAFPGEPPLAQFGLFRNVAAERLAGVRELLVRRVRTPLAHGAGRWFDAMAALLLGRSTASFEGQAALALELVADGADEAAYPFELAAAEPLAIDLRPAVRALVAERLGGASPARCAARFHTTLAVATAAAVREVLARFPALPLVLSGGCFANSLLTERLLGALPPGLEVLRHRHVPPGDGGLALGQVVAADAAQRRISCA